MINAVKVRELLPVLIDGAWSESALRMTGAEMLRTRPVCPHLRYEHLTSMAAHLYMHFAAVIAEASAA
jgi:hypothetical protein